MAFKMPASLTSKKPAGFGAFGGGGGMPGLPKPGGMKGLPPMRARAAAPPPGFNVRAKPRQNKLGGEEGTAPTPGGPSSANWDQVNKDTSDTVTFDATHRHWIGQVLLHKDHRFDKEGRGGGGGTWTVEWTGNAERGDLTGELVLTWSKWGPETLVTTDNGMTWVCDEYVFNLNLYGTPKLPDYMGTNATNEMPDADAPAPDRTSPPSRGAGQGGGERDWGRARDTQSTVPTEEDDGDTTKSAPVAAEKKAAPAAGGRRPGGRRRMGFKMPSRQERAAAVCKKYRDIGEILEGAIYDPVKDQVKFEGKMKDAEAPEIVGFLKIAIADLYQINHLPTKFSRTTPEGETITEETNPAGLLGMKKADIAALEKFNLVKYLESDHEKRMKILAPVAQKAFAVIAPYLATTLASSATSAADVRSQNCRCDVCGVDLLRTQLEKHNGGKKHLKMLKLSQEK